MKSLGVGTLLALLTGALTVAGFAPFGLWPAPILSLTVLMLLWRRAPSPWACARLGFWWGLGCFLAGVNWLDISLHDYGGMPQAAAIPGIVGLCALLAAFPAAVGWGAARFFGGRPKARWLIAVPALWTLAEWVRSWFLTGFPWLSLGYAQTPHGPFAGVAPVLGVFGVTAASVLLSGLLAALATARRDDHALGPLAGAVLLLVGAGLGLGRVAWTHPVGVPLSVNLLQGNVPQDQKFQRDETPLIVQRYLNLLKGSPGHLILMPESALPYVREMLPESIADTFERYGYDHDADLLVGLFSEPARGQYYNSVVSFGHSPSQTYQKVHLVPFGEFIPLEGLLKPLLHALLTIPIDSQQHGSPDQPPLRVAGQYVGVDICYEDAFGDEILHALPQATVLANFTNDGWFGDSIGPEQHLQMAQTRALETGRSLLRVTNTGVTAIIDPRGRLLVRAPRGEVFNLSGMVQGYAGRTPFVVLGNYGILALCLLALVLSIPLNRRP